MDKSNIDIFLENNRLYADGQSTHKQLTLASNPTSHPDARRVACMDARHDVEDLRVCSPAKRTSSAMRGYGHRGCDSLPDHFAPPAEHQRNHPHPPHPLRVLAFTDDLLKAGLEGDPAAEKLIGQATNRTFVTTGKASASPIAFHAFRFRGQPDTGRSAQRAATRAWSVSHGTSDAACRPY